VYSRAFPRNVEAVTNNLPTVCEYGALARVSSGCLRAVAFRIVTAQGASWQPHATQVRSLRIAAGNAQLEFQWFDRTTRHRDASHGLSLLLPIETAKLPAITERRRRPGGFVRFEGFQRATISSRLESHLK
jgi:hypothetical protein